MGKNRPPIPESIKREVRQKCGFGCVICGMPIYSYHHIEEYNKVKEHKSENLTLLCSNHHTEYHSKLLTMKDVIKATLNPCNMYGKSKNPYFLNFKSGEYQIDIGSVSINPRLDVLSWGIPLLVDMMPLIMLRILDNKLYLTLQLFSEQNDMLLYIKDNELILNKNAWDITFIGNNLIIREGLGNIILDIEFIMPNRINIKRGRLKYKGRGISVENNTLEIEGHGKVNLLNCKINSIIGIAVGELPPGWGCAIHVK